MSEKESEGRAAAGTADDPAASTPAPARGTPELGQDQPVVPLGNPLRWRALVGVLLGSVALVMGLARALGPRRAVPLCPLPPAVGGLGVGACRGGVALEDATAGNRVRGHVLHLLVQLV